MITASIVIHNSNEDLLKDTLHSLCREDIDILYLIDNSQSDSLSKYQNFDKRIEYRHIENHGFGNAHNVAIRDALSRGSDFHLILNPDVRWDEQILPRLIKKLNSDGNIGLIQPRILYPDGSLQHTCRLLPRPYDVFAKRFLNNRFTRKNLDKYLLPDNAYLHEFNAVYMQGSFMLFKTGALREIGLFDERFFMYPEDIDITRRIREKYKALYFPEVSIIHNHAAESAKFGKMMFIHIWNMIKYFNKWGWFFDKNRTKLNKQLIEDIDGLINNPAD